MNIKLANALFDDGVFSEMYKAGFITTKIFLYREIFLWVNAQQQIRNLSKNQAVMEAGAKFKKDERTVWRALNCFTMSESKCLNHDLQDYRVIHLQILKF